MKPTAALPNWVGWIVRAFVWAIVLTAALGGLYFIGMLRLPESVEACLGIATEGGQTALVRTQRITTCIDDRAGMLEQLVYFRIEGMVAALPATPCRFVGTWTSSRPPNPDYVVELKADSEFTATPTRTAGEIITGSWGVHDDWMIWMYDTGLVWPPDSNRIIDASETGFTLVEVDGEHTRFERTDAASCSN